MGSIADLCCPRCNNYSPDGELCDVCANISVSSQALVERKLQLIGIDIARPVRENAPYDLLMKSWGEWRQVQVKTAYDTKEGVRANVCRPNKTGRKLYREDQVDYFAIVYGEEVFLIPFVAVKDKGRINVLSNKYRKWKMR